MQADSLKKLFKYIQNKCSDDPVTALELITEPDGNWELYVDIEEGLRFERDCFSFRLINERGQADSYADWVEIKEISLTLPYGGVRAVSQVVTDYRDIDGLKSDMRTGPHHRFQMIVDPAVLWGWPWSHYRKETKKGKKRKA